MIGHSFEFYLFHWFTSFSQANIHSFLESDDRIAKVVHYLDDAIQELDSMETTISSYKIHLNVSRSIYPRLYKPFTMIPSPRLSGMILPTFNLSGEVCKCRIKTRRFSSMNSRNSWCEPDSLQYSRTCLTRSLANGAR